MRRWDVYAGACRGATAWAGSVLVMLTLLLLQVRTPTATSHTLTCTLTLQYPSSRQNHRHHILTFTPNHIHTHTHTHTHILILARVSHFYSRSHAHPPRRPSQALFYAVFGYLMFGPNPVLGTWAPYYKTLPISLKNSKTLLSGGLGSMVQLR